MLTLLSASTALLHSPSCSRDPLRPSLALASHRAAVVRLTEDASQPAWPAPAKTVEELQAEATAAKEAEEAATREAAAPLTTESGTFSYVALVTVLVFFVGGGAFFQGITGGGVAKFLDDDPEVQACVRAAATRNDASKCLPPVPKGAGPSPVRYGSGS